MSYAKILLQQIEKEIEAEPDLNFVIRAIDSCKTYKQTVSAHNLIDNLRRKHPVLKVRLLYLREDLFDKQFSIIRSTPCQ